MRGMSLLSVADVIQDPTDPPSKLPGLRLAYDGPDARVYRERQRAAADVPGRSPAGRATAATRRSRRPRTPPSTRATWRSPRARCPGSRPRRRAPAIAGSARLERYDRERVVARATAKRKSLLVLTDVHYPGWKATVDGKPADIERVDYLLRGVVVPAGTHTVEFSYRARQLARRLDPQRASACWRSSAWPRWAGGGDAKRGKRAELPPGTAGARGGADLCRHEPCSSWGRRCCPGRRSRTPTRSGSSRRSSPPSRPTLKTPSNPELGDATTQLQPFVHHTARTLPHIPLWDPVHRRAGARSGQRPVGGLRPLQRARLRPAVLDGARLDRGAEALGGGLRDLPARPRAGHALRRRAARGDRLRAEPEDGHVALVSAHERVDVHPVAAACSPTGSCADRACWPAPGWPPSSRSSSCRGTPSRASTRCWRRWRSWCCGSGRRAASGWRARCRRCARCWRSAAAIAGGAALAAVSLIPFAELLLHSADLHDRGGYSVDIALDIKEAIGIFLPDWWGRPTQTPIRIFVIERALYVGALPLMLVAAALVLRPKVERVAVALFGFLWFAVVLSIPPFLQIVSRLPIFNSGHNTRLIILTMFAASLLAGWGFDDLTDARARPAPAAQPAARHRGRAARRAADRRRGAPAPDARRPQGRLRRSPGCSPTRRASSCYPIGADVIRMSAIIMWLHARRRRRCC